MKKLGIYIHIPFCLSKCRYCAFFSEAGKSESDRRRYAEEIKDDIRAYGKEYGEEYIVDTVFIGGGTPSIMEEGLIADIMKTLGESFVIEENAEITIESNPKTLTEKKLLEYRNAGINRLSMGLQSFDDKCLRSLGRAHSVSDFRENFDLARRCGFDNINIDLMFAFPDHTMESWESTLADAIELAPEHISFYSLQLEEGTPFYEMYRKGEIDLVDDITDRDMYHRAIKAFKDAGYNHYEISNCAKPGMECRHNIKYWSMDEYLGIGYSSSSYIDGVRFTEAPCPEFHQNSFADDTSEFVFTGLRKTRGISMTLFREKFGKDFREVFRGSLLEAEEFFDSGCLLYDGDYLRLSEKGIDVSNRIMSLFV